MPRTFETLRDGDDKDDEVYEGHMYVNAKSVTKPSVVDADCQAILDKEEFYSGCYGRASITFYAYNTSGNKGVACGLNHVQKLEEGERLGGVGSSAEEDFGDDMMG